MNFIKAPADYFRHAENSLNEIIEGGWYIHIGFIAVVQALLAIAQSIDYLRQSLEERR